MCKQQEKFKKKGAKRTHIQNQKETSEISWAYNEDAGLGKFDTYRKYQRQNR